MGRTKLSEGKPQILLVENDDSLSEVVGAALARQGFTYDSAHTGDEALEKAYRSKPQIVLLDTHLTGQSGYLVAGKLKIAAPSPKVVLMTSLPRGQSDRMAQFIGADAILHKPFAMAKLLATLERLLKRAHAA